MSNEYGGEMAGFSAETVAFFLTVSEVRVQVQVKIKKRISKAIFIVNAFAHGKNIISYQEASNIVSKIYTKKIYEHKHTQVHTQSHMHTQTYCLMKQIMTLMRTVLDAIHCIFPLVRSKEVQNCVLGDF